MTTEVKDVVARILGGIGSTFEDELTLSGDEARSIASLLESLSSQVEVAVNVLRDHHEWHAGAGVIGLPDGDGGWIEMDEAAEYGDSRLCQRTMGVLSNAPPVLKPIPRGGRASNHWENWQLAYREVKALRKELAAAESRATAAEGRVALLGEALGKLVDAEALAGVRSLVAGWNGETRPDGPYTHRHPDTLRATLPTNCGAVYALDDAMQAARARLAKGGQS